MMNNRLTETSWSCRMLKTNHKLDDQYAYPETRSGRSVCPHSQFSEVGQQRVWPKPWSLAALESSVATKRRAHASGPHRWLETQQSLVNNMKNIYTRGNLRQFKYAYLVLERDCVARNLFPVSHQFKHAHFASEWGRTEINPRFGGQLSNLFYTLCRRRQLSMAIRPKSGLAYVA